MSSELFKNQFGAEISFLTSIPKGLNLLAPELATSPILSVPLASDK